MINYFLAFFIGINCYAQPYDLVKYYNGELKLSSEEIISLSDSLINVNQSNYLTALAYFQKASVLQSQDANFQAFEILDLSLSFLLKADTIDNFMHHAILVKQGLILKQYWMIDAAIEKYEQALQPAYAYSTERGLSVKYNLARAWALKEQERAIEILLEILDEAKLEALKDRITKVYNELGLILVRSGEYENAKKYFDKSLEYAEDKEDLAFTYQNYAHMYYESGKYEEQRRWLMKSLSLGEHRNRFVSLMDMGENRLISNETEQARTYLLESEKLYEDRPLNTEYIKVFEWLANACHNSDERLKYANKRGDELEKVVTIQQKLETKLRQQAMLQLLNKLEVEKSANKTINTYQILAAVGGVLALGILLTWRIWWHRLRKRLGKKILDIVNRWTDDV